MKLNKFILCCLLVLFASSEVNAQVAVEKSLTIENYYKIKWGHADEFIALWKKNHYPLLRKLKEGGDVLEIRAETPVFHSSEDSRWDFKVVLVFRNEHLALDYSITEPFKKQLFPDLAAYQKEEQHRFELVLAHWDVPVERIRLN